MVFKVASSEYSRSGLPHAALRIKSGSRWRLRQNLTLHVFQCVTSIATYGLDKGVRLAFLPVNG
jgi:hypothetical protein